MGKDIMIRTYTELIKLPTIEERFDYLMLNGKVGEETFGIERYLNQTFYHSREWREFRKQIILRDNGCDLAMDGFTIMGNIYVHHMNPISIIDAKGDIRKMINPEEMVCCSFNTHQGITYGIRDLTPRTPKERYPFDDCPWRQ